MVLNSYHHLGWTLQRQGQSGKPILLITCLDALQPTAAQTAGLALWLQQRRQRENIF